MANEMSAPAPLAPDATLVLGNNDDDFSAGHDSDATLSPETARLYRVEEEEESQRPDYRHAEYPPKYVGWQGNVRRAIPGVDFPLDDMPKGKEDLWYPIDELNALEKAAHAENETTEKTMDSAEKGQQRTGTEDETVRNCANVWGRPKRLLDDIQKKETEFVRAKKLQKLMEMDIDPQTVEKEEAIIKFLREGRIFLIQAAQGFAAESGDVVSKAHQNVNDAFRTLVRASTAIPPL